MVMFCLLCPTFANLANTNA